VWRTAADTFSRNTAAEPGLDSARINFLSDIIGQLNVNSHCVKSEVDKEEEFDY
jgi:hypothetical protein